MYPNNGSAFGPDGLPRLEAVADVVYNPSTGPSAAGRGAGRAVCERPVHAGGQAKYAAEYFTDKKIPDGEIESIYRDLRAKQANLVLIGMPSCGKTSLGKACAKLLGKRFVDLDAEIERQEGRPISQILAPGKETYFRDVESRVTAQFARRAGRCCPTGRGVVLREENGRPCARTAWWCILTGLYRTCSPGARAPVPKPAGAGGAVRGPRAAVPKGLPCKSEQRRPVLHGGGPCEGAFYEVLDCERA